MGVITTIGRVFSVVGVCAGVAFTATTLHADTLSDKRPVFFVGGDVRDIFGDQVAIAEHDELRFLPQEKRAEERKKAAAAKLKKKATPGKEVLPASKEEILAAYGDPEQEVPIQVVESAPRPFKAIMSALELGDEDLARAYARQYVRYVGRVSSQSEALAKLTSEVPGMPEVAPDRSASPAAPAIVFNKSSSDDAPQSPFQKQAEALITEELQMERGPQWVDPLEADEPITVGVP